jgi:hypothetical protein
MNPKLPSAKSLYSPSPYLESEDKIPLCGRDSSKISNVKISGAVCF